MYINTECIILNTVPYTDNKIIIHCYSDKKGKVSFMHYRAKGKRKSNTPYFYPFALMDVQFRDNDKKNLHTIHSSQHSEIHQSILTNPYKRSFALFLADFTHTIVREEEANTHLFQFIKTFISLLDAVKENYALYHLKYIIDISRYTGFFPDFDDPDPSEMHNIFSMQQMEQIKAINATPYDELNQVHISRTDVRSLLDVLIRFYELHFPEFKAPESLYVFREF